MPERVERLGEERTYTVQLYFFNDSSTTPARLDRSGWRAQITNPAGAEVKEFTRCWSQRRARNKARRWVKKRVLSSTKVAIVEALEGT